MDSALPTWQKYLRNDPTRFLLDAKAPPSIHLWYALDIANRPEDAPVVAELRERVLYSDTVQAILAAQKSEGYWDNPDSLVEPRYRATIWNLALLAELGIPRNSRRARQAIEFALQNMESLEEVFEVGHFLRAAEYFKYSNDSRILRLLEELVTDMEEKSGYGVAFHHRNFESALSLLWAIGRWRTSKHSQSISRSIKIVLSEIGEEIQIPPRTYPPYRFPHFDTYDDLFCLRILSEHNSAQDSSIQSALARVVAKQDDQARWAVGTSLNNQLIAPLPDAPDASYWMTLNAVRVIKSVVVG